MIGNIPGAPLIIGGQEFHTWHPVDGGARVLIRTNPDQTTIMLAQLGETIPGLDEEGNSVEFHIYTVQGLVDGGAEVLAHIQIPTGDVL